MNAKKAVLAVISLLALFSCTQRQQGRPQGAERKYPVMVVQRQDAELQNVYPVVLRGREDAEIKPRVSGYIDKVYIDEGAIVKKGQALFSINSPTSEHDLASAKAALETAESRLNTARLDVERIRPLAEKNIVSHVQLETYENAYKAAQASKKEAEVALRAAQATSSWTTVTSPINGVVGSIPFRSGNMVTSATTLTSVSNTETVYAYFSLNEKAFVDLLSKLQGNTVAEKINHIPPVSLTLADGSLYPEKGSVSSISGIINTGTGSVNLRAAFPNPQGLLRSGASGRIAIPRKVENVFVIPQKSTFALQDKVVLYKVVNDSTLQSIVEAEPLPDGQNFVVTGGLEDGDLIVVDGVGTLRNGQKIQVLQN